MWISRKKFEELERKVAVLEKEQLLVADSIKSNEELLRVVRELKVELSRIKIINANTTEQLSEVRKIIT